MQTFWMRTAVRFANIDRPAPATAGTSTPTALAGFRSKPPATPVPHRRSGPTGGPVTLLGTTTWHGETYGDGGATTAETPLMTVQGPTSRYPF